MALGHHAVDAGESIYVPKWNSPQGVQVHCTNACAGRHMSVAVFHCLVSTLF